MSLVERAVTEQQGGGYVPEIRLHFSVSVRNLFLSVTFIYLITVFHFKANMHAYFFSWHWEGEKGQIFYK